jgi:hypothetical protein
MTPDDLHDFVAEDTAPLGHRGAAGEYQGGVTPLCSHHPAFTLRLLVASMVFKGHLRGLELRVALTSGSPLEGPNLAVVQLYWKPWQPGSRQAHLGRSI